MGDLKIRIIHIFHIFCNFMTLFKSQAFPAMEKYLTSLLESNHRVIVPDLGAFIIRQKEPKELVFNDLLAFDDGILAAHVMQQEDISKPEARSRVKQFVEKVKKQLEAGDPFQLKKLGTLTMESGGRIEFTVKEKAGKEPLTETEATVVEDTENDRTEDAAAGDQPTARETADSSQEASSETTGEETQEPPAEEPAEGPGEGVEEIPEAAEVQETQGFVREPEEGSTDDAAGGSGFVLSQGDADVEVDATTEDQPLVPDREEPPFQIDESDEKEITGDAAEPESTAKVESTTEPESTPETETTEEKATEDRTGPAPEPSENPFSAYTAASYHKKRKSWPWIVAALGLGLILLAVACLVFPERVSSVLHMEKKELPADETQASVPETEPAAAGLQEPAPAIESRVPLETADAVPERQTPESVSQTEGRYYVVAGCFADIRNAENYVTTLKNRGYDASVFGMRKNLHAVCFNSHPTRQDAIEELERIRDTYDPKAWVLYY